MLHFKRDRRNSFTLAFPQTAVQEGRFCYQRGELSSLALSTAAFILCFCKVFKKIPCSLATEEALLGLVSFVIGLDPVIK